MTKQRIFLETHCFECDSPFVNKSKLVSHLSTQHKIYLPAGIKGTRSTCPQNGVFIKNKSEADMTYYCCPSCPAYFPTLLELRSHVQEHGVQASDLGKDIDNGDDDDVATSEQVIIADPLPIPIPESSTYNNDNKNTNVPTRDYEDAILYACDELYTSGSNKNKATYIIETLNLLPFSITKNGIEQNALASERVLKKLTADHQYIHSIIPSKRRFVDESEPSTTSNYSYPQPIYDLIALSPYQKALIQREYIELDDKLCDLVNIDLKFNPHFKYSIAQLFAGCVLINLKNGHALMVNVVELYGRTKSVDVHREVFGIKNNCNISTSLPPAFNTKYNDVWPTTLHHKDGKKLLIGTQTCNLLVTSSLRLDTKSEPMVGPSTPQFELDKNGSLNTLIFLDSQCIQSAISIAKKPNTTSVTSRNLVFQARQLQSKYHLPSTYFLCRATGPITRSHNCYPYTIFTIADYDNGRNTQARIFSHLIENVLKLGKKASLDKLLVQKIYSKAAGDSKTTLSKILDLFDGKSSQLTIIDNEPLNNLLEELSTALSTTISTANKSSQAAIINAFSSFD